MSDFFFGFVTGWFLVGLGFFAVLHLLALNQFVAVLVAVSASGVISYFFMRHTGASLMFSMISDLFH